MTFAFSLPRGQRSWRHLEQSPGVFMVSSSRSRRLVCVTLSLPRSVLYVVRASVDNVVPVVVIRARVAQLLRFDNRETCRHPFPLLKVW